MYGILWPTEPPKPKVLEKTEDEKTLSKEANDCNDEIKSDVEIEEVTEKHLLSKHTPHQVSMF